MSFSRDLFEEGSVIARNLPGFETRPQQIQMAEAVTDAITSSQNLIVEAGAGVGKSLAYLVPFIHWAWRENKKVVISTYTKALQNQLFIKDLPFLSKVLDLEFRYAICMGSANFVCLRKADKSSRPKLAATKKVKKQLGVITKWLQETKTGLVTDMAFAVDRFVWGKFSRESDFCLGRKCSYYKQCFYMKARAKQSKAHILVTNHALLFTNMMAETEVLPQFHGLVLDEAHTLEDIATTHFGKVVSSTALQHLIEGISDFCRCEDSASPVIPAEAGIYKKDIKKLKSVSDKFFKRTEEIFGQEKRTARFDIDQFSTGNITKALETLSASLRETVSASGDSEDREIARMYAQKCEKFSELIDFVFEKKRDKYVYWVEVDKRKTGVNYSFHAAPIDVSDEMRKHIFEKICPTILTSATLSLSRNGQPDFSFVKHRLGLENTMELALDSPFDYAKQVLMYLPHGGFDPNRDFDGFRDQVKKEIISIYDIMGGRIFALFTSYQMLNTVAGNIANEREDINILKQGDLPRYVLLDVFKKNTNSILMGTTTFWQGVDVSGSALECVIITKLPFSVPTDPINALRIKSIQDEGGNPFIEYQVPQAVIMFKQGFGRLIRSHSDRGIVAILDPRIRTRYYGKDFINALPKCRETSNLQKVKDFFQPK